MEFSRGQYICAAHTIKQFPVERQGEIAFAGRSNAGKSSAINAITNVNGLAKTSKLPGRTRQIVFFDLPPDFFLVDLPGYGYAKASQTLKQHWSYLIESYLKSRPTLLGVVVMMDIRHPLSVLDFEIIRYCRHHNLKIHILLTKSDKLGFGRGKSVYHQVVNQVGVLENVSVQLFSALKKTGIIEAQQKIRMMLTGESHPDLE